MYMNKEFRYPQIYTVNSYMNSYTECFCRIISFMTDMLFIYIYSCIIHIYMNLCTMYIMMNSQWFCPIVLNSYESIYDFTRDPDGVVKLICVNPQTPLTNLRTWQSLHPFLSLLLYQEHLGKRRKLGRFLLDMLDVV